MHRKLTSTEVKFLVYVIVYLAIKTDSNKNRCTSLWGVQGSFELYALNLAKIV